MRYQRTKGTAGDGGIVFQFRLIILFLWEALCKIKEGTITSFQFNKIQLEEFEYVTLKYQNSSSSRVILLHTKYKYDDDSENNNRYVRVTLGPHTRKKTDSCSISLLKAFHIYQTLKQNTQSNDLSNVKIVFCTNGPISMRGYALEDVLQAYCVDDIETERLQMFTYKDGSCFKFSDICRIAEDLHKALVEYSDCYKLANDIITKNKIDTSVTLVNKYYTPLIANMTKCENAEKKSNEAPTAKFNSEFISGDDVFARKLNDLCDNISERIIKLPATRKNKDKPKLYKDTLPNDIPSLNEVKEFLEKVRFFTEQPNNASIKDELKTKWEMQYSIHVGEQDNSFSLLEDKIKGWWGSCDTPLNETNDFIQTSLKVSFSFGVNQSVKYFTGREKEVNTIAKDHAAGYYIIALCGLGGMGKTELAKEYITRKGYWYDHNTIWINGKQLDTSFKQLASELNIDCTDKQLVTIIEQVYTYFSKRKSLFIFDNVDNTKEFELTLGVLKNLQDRPYFLITSRHREWMENIRKMDLEVFEIDEAITLVCDSLNIVHKKEVEDLVNLLHRYPLVLRQAISYIENKTESEPEMSIDDAIREFISNYEKIKPQVLSLQLNEYKESTATTWNVTINEIKHMPCGELAVKILNILAYIAPTNITNKMLFKLDTASNVDKALRLLLKYSMINCDKGIFNIHEVVQEVFRLQNYVKQDILKETLSLFDEINRSIVDHAMYAWRYATEYEDLVREFGWFSHEIILILFNESRFTDGYDLAQDSLQTFNDFNMSSDSDYIIKTRKICAKVLFRQCEYETSMNEYNEIKEIEIRKYGELSQEVFITKNDIALILRHQAKYEEALEMFKVLLAQEEKHLGKGNSITLRTRDEVATILKHRGKYKEALEEYLQIIHLKNEKEEELEESYDEATLTTMDNIVTVYNYLGMFTKSEQQFDKVLKIKRKHLSENDPSVSRTLNNKGVLLIRQGKFDEALKIFKERLEKLKRVYNKPSTPTIITKYNISLIHYCKGELKEAWKICEDNLKNSISLLTAKHKITLQISQLKGDILYMEGDWKAAKSMFEDIISVGSEVLGSDTMETLQTQNSLGRVLLTEGDLPLAMDAFQNVCRKKVKLFDRDHPEVLITLFYIGKVYEAQGKLCEACSIYKQVYEKRLECLGESHYLTVEVLNELTQVKQRITWYCLFTRYNKYFLFMSLIIMSVFCVIYYSVSQDCSFRSQTQ